MDLVSLPFFSHKTVLFTIYPWPFLTKGVPPRVLYVLHPWRAGAPTYQLLCFSRTIPLPLLLFVAKAYTVLRPGHLPAANCGRLRSATRLANSDRAGSLNRPCLSSCPLSAVSRQRTSVFHGSDKRVPRGSPLRFSDLSVRRGIPHHRMRTRMIGVG
jgi:hypothetical protein